MEHAYAPVLEEPVIADAWKRGPVQMEVCGYIHEWYERGFDLDRILEKGLGVACLGAEREVEAGACRVAATLQ